MDQAARALPSGEVTFAFVDVVGSTVLFQKHAEAYVEALAQVQARISAAALDGHGQVVSDEGDGALLAFCSAEAAVRCLVGLQQSLDAPPEGLQPHLRVRIGLHRGAAVPVNNGYVALAVHIASRVCSAAHAGQVVASQAVVAAVAEPDPGWADLGPWVLRDVLQPVVLWRLSGEERVPSLARSARVSRLPTPLTPTFGREQALDELEALLTGRVHRLVTLTGPGGGGKTRLAVEAATRVQERFRDGAVLVALEAVKEPALALTTMAAALGVRETGAEPLATLTSQLRGREVLVLLDNLEQVLAVGPALSELLAMLPGLTLLATSRVLLAVTPEHAFPVGPLALPAAARPDAVSDSPAVALFCERAQAAFPAFALTQDNAGDVAELCRRLDGLPLALELAAAQSRTLAPAELLTRLRSRLDAPGPGQRDRPARHQSLRSALEGSYEQLSPTSRSLFAALSVFVGGFDLTTTEAVCGATPAGLAELIDHSVVQVSSARGHRFTMLDTVREFAAERLDDDTFTRRHSAYFLALAEQASADVDGPRQADVLDRLDREHDNLRAAFAGLVAAGDVEGELRLAVALARFWYIRGHLSESRTRLSAALGRAAALPPQLEADALRKVSANEMLLGDYAEALGHAEKALAIYDEINDPLGRARSLSNIGSMAAAAGSYERAAASLDEAIALAREIGADRVMALAVNNRGDLCLTLGEFDQATVLFAESRSLLEAQGDSTNVARSLLNLALSALGRRAHHEAAELVAQSLDLCVQLGDAEDVAWCLLAQAALLTHTGDPEQAALLLGAAERVLREIDGMLKPYERSLHAATTAALTEKLGPGAFGRGLAHGSRLELREAVAIARGC